SSSEEQLSAQLRAQFGELCLFSRSNSLGCAGWPPRQSQRGLAPSDQRFGVGSSCSRAGDPSTQDLPRSSRNHCGLKIDIRFADRSENCERRSGTRTSSPRAALWAEKLLD